MYTFVVDKDDLRLMFVTSAHNPLMLDALWPSVGYNYLIWHHQIKEEVRQAPWDYVIQQNLIVHMPMDKVSAEMARENRDRARLLLELGAGVNRHRRQVLKEDLIGQDLVYGAKIEEARRFLANPSQPSDDFLWLCDAARFDGITVQQAAEAIVFRYTQAQSILMHSENRRRHLIREILTRPLDQLNVVAEEVREYVRRG